MSDKFSVKNKNSTNVRSKTLRLKMFTIYLWCLWRVAPAIARHTIFKNFFTPRRYPLTDDQRRTLERGRRFHIHVNGKRVVCWKWGTGPVVLLVHGWNGRGVHLGAYMTPLLDAGYAVMTFDAPAHGESEGSTTNYFEFTDTIRAILGSAHGSTITGIVAHSIGGAASIAALAKENRTVSMALIAPALKIRELLHNTFSHYGIPRPLYLDIISRVEERHGYDLRVDNPCDLAAMVPLPFLIAHDRNDTLIPYMDARKLHKEFPHVSLLTTSGLGHKRLISDPEVMDRVLAEVTRPVNIEQRIQNKA